MSVLEQIKRKIETELSQLQQSDKRTTLKEKLLEELKALEGKYDDQIAAQRKELTTAAAGEKGAEAEGKLREMQEKLGETTKAKQEADKKVRDPHVFFSPA
jgi:hypothetical protein